MLLVKRFSIVFILSFINVIDVGTHFPHVGFDYYVRDPIKAIKNYCPSYVSCSERHANDNQNLTHLELPEVNNGTCCIPCKCDDMCFHRGDCCYDKQLHQEHVDRSRINVYRSAEENITCWQAHTYQGFIDHAFLLLQDCDAPGNDPEVNDLREKCFNPSWDSMEENTPVYSKIDGGHYRNIFCAKCSNSVHDFVPWTVELGCYYDIDAFQLISVWNGSGFSQSLQNACSVIWEPPTDHLLPVKCHKPVVESCRDGDFPADISVLCTNYSTSASAPMLLFNKLYRNVYCAVCNYAVFEAPELFLSVLCIHGQHILRPQWPFVFVLKYSYRYETEPNETDDESPHDSVLVFEIVSSI
ncbi:hypothetical protein DPMN_045717 [Dreissena polymorpha]|uniref:SMB domain-containing protein n=1 Tax=Dreissena polymorpha TaxID=45954 RepID=A0A9D4D6M8_DREPO|nr:hypothetical protein DPMN_045717 [Dreissena polymorpha]